MLRSSKTGKSWADQAHTLGQFVYTTYDEADFNKAFGAYQYHGEGGFVKPGVDKWANPLSKDWYPILKSFYQNDQNMCEFLLEMEMADPITVTYYGAASKYWMRVTVTDTIEIDIQWFNKTTTRLPEAHWLVFNPITEVDQGGYWLMDKLGLLVDPQHVMKNGSQHQHGIWEGVRYYSTSSLMLQIDSLDAPVVSPFKKSPFPAPDMSPQESIAGGMSFNLYNNIWDTNYILWYPYVNLKSDAHSLFRFTIQEKPFTNMN